MIGVGYQTGPFGATIEYGESTLEEAATGVGNPDQDGYLQNFVVNVSYDAGPGVTFGGALMYSSASSVGVETYEDYALGAGMKLAF